MTYLELVVRDSAGTALTFDSGNVYDPSGTRTTIEFTSDDSTLTLHLPLDAEGYTFTVFGYEDAGGQFLAYGEAHEAVTADMPPVQLGVQTLLGSATLAPVAPLKQALPGQVLDLHLDVRTPGGAYSVPLADLEVTYDLSAGMGSLTSESKLGARVAVAETPTSAELVLTAVVHGLTPAPEDPDSVGGTLPSRPNDGGSVTATFRVPVLEEGGAWLDLTMPTVTFAAPGAVEPGASVVLAGSADDDVGIDRLDVYEGTRLIGSSAIEEQGPDVAAVTFEGTAWSMTWQPPAEADYALKAVAVDTSGNQSVAEAVLFGGGEVATAGTDSSVPAVTLSLAPGATQAVQIEVPDAVAASGDILYVELDAALALEVEREGTALVSTKPSVFGADSGAGAGVSLRAAGELAGAVVARACRGSCVILPSGTATVTARVTNSGTATESVNVYAFATAFGDTGEPNDSTGSAVAVTDVASGAIETLGDVDYFEIAYDAQLWFDSVADDPVGVEAEIYRSGSSAGLLAAGGNVAVLAGDFVAVRSGTGQAGAPSDSHYFLELVPTVDEVVIDQESLAIDVGSSVMLTVGPTGADGQAPEVTWTSSEETVAIVSAAGVVTGTEEGSATITATSVVNTAISDSITVSVVSEETFNIDLVFFSETFTTSQRAAFEQAAALWSDVITNDLEDVPINVAAGEACGLNEPAYDGTVDDLVIFVTSFTQDMGGLLGVASPCLSRSGGSDAGTTAIGYMELDKQDLGVLEMDGLLVDTILHEMGHVLGIGTNWEFAPYYDLLDYVTTTGVGCTAAASADFLSAPVYTGSGGRDGYAVVGGSGNVPVEEEYGSGTACGHWDEEIFDNELMTGFLNKGASNPLSLVTVQSLTDLGFMVDASRADAYVLPYAPALRAAPDSFPIGAREVLLPPRGGIDVETGELVPPPPRLR